MIKKQIDKEMKRFRTYIRLGYVKDKFTNFYKKLNSNRHRTCAGKPQ